MLSRAQYLRRINMKATKSHWLVFYDNVLQQLYVGSIASVFSASIDL